MAPTQDGRLGTGKPADGWGTGVEMEYHESLGEAGRKKIQVIFKTSDLKGLCIKCVVK